MTSKLGARAEYFRYLTARLDRGESKNIVISTSADLIKQKLAAQEIVRVLDVGCFSGAMLNRIAHEVGLDHRNRLRLTGVDQDEEVMEIGAGKYPDITYTSADLKGPLPLVAQYDIVILSNVLHEVIDGNGFEKNKSLVYPVFSRITGLLNPGGSIVVFDGLKPDESDKQIIVNFQEESQRQMFEIFAEKYKATRIVIRRYEGKAVSTTVGSLAAFLTKARYLNETYWKSESEQLYQYFTLDDFIQMIEANKLTVDRAEPQHFSPEETNKTIISTEPEIKLPAKFGNFCQISS